MIVFITTRGYRHTLKSVSDGTFGVPTPKFRWTHYERLFGAWRVPRATYIFGDIERLAPWELRIAADLYRSMTAAGLRCLNDPARVMSRAELLTTLHRVGINPFSAYRADTSPRPARFPVFIRPEDNHAAADAALHFSQSELDQALEALRKSGTPLRGLLVIEQAAEQYSDGLWAKWGTWRIGDRMIVEHIAVDDTWLVKIGDHKKVNDTIAADEHDAVSSNRFATDVGKAFELAHVEFGRSDHAMIAGRTVVYEINTNPYLGWLNRGNPSGLRHRSQLIARQRIADALSLIDTKQRGLVSIPKTRIRRPIRWWRPGFVTPRRP